MTVAGLELAVVEQFLMATLVPDDTLIAMLGDHTRPEVGILSETVRKDVTYPYVIFNLMNSSDSLTSDGTTVIVVADMLVKGVDRSEEYEALKPIHQRLYQLLHQQSGTTADGKVLKCVRQRQVKFPSINETIQYRHLGGIFRFWVEGP